MKHLNKTIIAPALLASLLLQSNSASAQDALTTSDNPAAEAHATINRPTLTAEKRDWQLTAGGGLLVRPTYEGSDRYSLLPLPIINATYNDMISIGIGGVSAYWHDGPMRLGAGLTYHGGRKDHKSGAFVSRGDDRLIGMGNIRASLGARAFGSYTASHITFKASATKFTGSDNRGLLIDAGLSMPRLVGRRLILKPHLNATWADSNYMQTFFGVSAAQAIASRFTAFRAKAGLKDVRIGIDANYRLDRHWFLGINADYKRLTGDAARSPLTFAKSQFKVMTLAGYRF
jgi:outer membrane scaffolding protein for murein synthesis (MipA/OmpV family)